MCGIFGQLAKPGYDPDWKGLDAASVALRHRGPDDDGWMLFSRDGMRVGRQTLPRVSAEAVFVHRRLSILDLSAAGRQPMVAPDGRFCIVYNGEIYNFLELREQLARLGHGFISQSDTEVLMHAFMEWGVEALRRFTGMFAFAILDARERMVLLARDFFGIKPLYYCQSESGLAFSSEIQALLGLAGMTAIANPQRLFEYLRFGLTDHGSETLFKGVLQVPAGHYIRVPLDRVGEKVAPVCYWKLAFCQPVDISMEEGAARTRELFLKNVDMHLRSDVPVGAALSGGIDSSAIVMAMRHLRGKSLDIHAFSYIAEDKALSEESWVDLVGAAAGAQMHKVSPRGEDVVADLDSLIQTQEEPFGSTSIYAQRRVFQLAGEQKIKVMLDGQGADEMLGGYHSYFSTRLASLLRQGRVLQAFLFAWRAACRPGGERFRLLARAASVLLPSRLHPFARRLMGEEVVPSWLDHNWFTARGVRLEAVLPPKGEEGLQGVLRHTLTATSLPMLLRYEDRNSMSFSIESRVPFLTPEFVEFLLGLPEELVISPEGISKAVFRRAMRGIVPDPILDRRDKIGFATPERRWLDLLAPWVESVIKSGADRVPVLRREALLREWDGIRQKRRPFDSRVWRWINVIRWVERFGVGFA